MADDRQILSDARDLLANEARALERLAETLGQPFVQAVHLIAGCRGRVITSGIGKAGIIARKIGATMASTGTPADFLHPTEALHGDLGRVSGDDVVLALSNSGTTEELLRLVGPVAAIGAATIAITGEIDSPLGQNADVVLAYGQVAEACPLGLAPTTSTTVMLALGDALAMAVLTERSLSPADFARYHPGGNLGRSLMKVGEVMRQSEALPLLASGAPLARAIDVMTSTPGRPGAVLVTAADGGFAGFYTDGDLRRNLLTGAQGGGDILARPIDDFMTTSPVTIRPDALVGDAMRILREKHIDQLPVVDEGGRPVGLLDVQDLLTIRAFAWSNGN